MMQGVTTLLFDFDGTLVPSLDFWVRAFHHAFGHYGLPQSDETIIARCFYRSHLTVAEEFGIEGGEEFVLKVREGLAHAFADVTAFPHVRELLDECRAAGYATAIVTSGRRAIVQPALQSLDLHGHFDILVTADDQPEHKPHPAPVLSALKQLNRAPGESLMIGDSTADILAGHAAGTRTALFLPEDHRRFYCFDTLRGAQPHFVFSSHDELAAQLGLTVQRAQT